MIPELGQFALILACGMTLIQAIAPWLRLNSTLLSSRMAYAQFLFVGISFVLLALAFLMNDFSVAYVAQHSNTHLPWFYRICAVWGAHEGSMLLWVLILALWGSLVALMGRKLPDDLYVQILSVMAWVGLGFYIFLLATSDPFLRLLPNFPMDGRDLNPVLQDPGLAIHPPVLYMGYVGFAVPFAFAVASMINGKMNAKWAEWVKPWVMVAWCFLTLGIVMGSWWAYRELGWGGWWFWDPVENASFLPWLVGTALIHSLIVTAKRDAFKGWTLLLAITAFALSLLGTFLVRSGVLISVHAFAVDPARGLYMLSFLMVVIGAALALYAWRGRNISGSATFSLHSRETLLLSNNVILFVAMLTVLLGTLYPLIMTELSLGKLSVGAPYFNTVFVPLMLPLLLLMGWVPIVKWRQAQLDRSDRWVSLFCALGVLSIFVCWFLLDRRSLMTIVGVSVCAWLILHTLLTLRKSFAKRQLGMMVAHLGIAVTALGIIVTTHYSQHRNLNMGVGEIEHIKPYAFQLAEVYPIKGPNFHATQARFIVSKEGHQITTLYPELRQFDVQQMSMSKTAIDVNLWRDLYVALGSKLKAGRWSVRIYYKPGVRWIWYGGFIMILGALISLLQSIRRGARRDDFSEI